MFDYILYDKSTSDKQITDSSYSIISSGNLSVNFLILTDLSILLDGNGDIESINDFYLNRPLDLIFDGTSEVILVTIGDMDVSFIYFEDITLAPGEEITIDTELLIVLFGETHDVSSISNDSEFFELGPGFNELAFFPEYDVTPRPGEATDLEIKLIWQNRWL